MYSKTPPRPILTSEKQIPITTQLSSKSYEFSLVSELFKYESYKVAHITKTFSYTLHKQLEQNIIKNPANDTKNNILLFHSGSYRDLQTICNNTNGFSSVYSQNHHKKVLFSARINKTD